MTDDLEELLQRFRPVGPLAPLRERIVRLETPSIARIRRWPLRLFRSAIAAMLLVSFALFYAANRLDHDSVASVSTLRWTADAQQAADLIGPGPASRQYIAICLIASKGRLSQGSTTQGEFR